MSATRTASDRWAALLLIGLAVPAALAQGQILIEREIMPPRPGPGPGPGPGQATLALRSLRVTAEITDGVAVTSVEQTFQNPLPSQIEGTFIFPLPDDVAVGDFAMTVGGKTLHGEVLDADTARRTYEDIVRRARDPGLLELLGARLFRARVFPIPGHGTVEIKLQYSQTLVEQAGLGLFRHPLRLDAGGARPIDLVAINVRLHSTLPLTTVFSPSHNCAITRRNDYEASASYEAARTQPDRDFLLYYRRKDSAFGIALLAYRAAGEPGSFFLRVSPRVDPPADQVLPKDIAFVIDTSGSMAGPKIEQAKRALKFCIESLAPEDRFNIYAFSTEVHPFRDALAPASSDLKAAATDFISQLRAAGGTNINAALLGALEDQRGDSERPHLIVFMTDGMPTVDVTDPERLRENVSKKNTRNARLHVLGVGSDVNTHLLDRLAEATRGSRDYCTENEDLEIKLSALGQRLANPVLTDVKLRIEGVSTFDVYPRELPDLFRGNDLVVLGRYDGSGPVSIRLEGQVLGRATVVGFEGELPKLDSRPDFLPRLWANRKVAYLLDQIRLHGSNKELIDEVIRLAKRYGIVTPYTSSLILEEDGRPGDGPRLLRERLRRADMSPGAGGGGRVAPSYTQEARAASGRGAVEMSQELKKSAAAATLPEADDAYTDRDAHGERIVRHVADRAFVHVDDRWTDTLWDGKTTPKQVKTFSDDYFDLLAKHPELKKFFALGQRVLVVLGDEVYETLPAE